MRAKPEGLSSQEAVVWHPTDLTMGASTGGPQGIKAQAHADSWVQRGSPASRVREPRNNEPADAQKERTRFVETGSNAHKEDTTPEGQCEQ